MIRNEEGVINDFVVDFMDPFSTVVKLLVLSFLFADSAAVVAGESDIRM